MNQNLEGLEGLAEVGNRRQDIRLKCLELAALMSDPQTPVEGETVQQFLNRFVSLSNVIELHVTGNLPSARS
jgi:hypothetical protein